MHPTPLWYVSFVSIVDCAHTHHIHTYGCVHEHACTSHILQGTTTDPALIHIFIKSARCPMQVDLFTHDVTVFPLLNRH